MCVCFDDFARSVGRSVGWSLCVEITHSLCICEFLSLQCYVVLVKLPVTAMRWHAAPRRSSQPMVDGAFIEKQCGI